MPRTADALDQCPVLAADDGLQSPANLPRQRGRPPAGRHGDLQLTAPEHRAVNEVAGRWPVHRVDQRAVAPRSLGDGVIDGGETRRGDYEHRAPGVRSAERTRAVVDAAHRREPRELGHERGTDDGDSRAALEQAMYLARCNRTAPDHEAAPAAHIQKRGKL